MAADDAKTQPALGFLTVLEQAPHGLMGGYLVLNGAGRPLEFHCTAPIKPNRAQQILYGPTLEPYLYGEQIGQALAAKASLEPLLICTDLRPALAVRSVIDTPVALVLAENEAVQIASRRHRQALRPARAAPMVRRPPACALTRPIKVAHYCKSFRSAATAWPCRRVRERPLGHPAAAGQVRGLVRLERAVRADPRVRRGGPAAAMTNLK